MIAGITLNMSKEFMNGLKIKKPKAFSMHEIDFNILWGYFNGAYKGHPSQCGVGVILYITQNDFFHVCYIPGNGTNKKAELIALWTRLEVASKKEFISHKFSMIPR